MLFRRLILAIPMGIAWMLLTTQVSLESFAVGYILGLAIIVVVQGLDVRQQVQALPAQVWALVYYIGKLYWDITASSIDVAKRIIKPQMPLNTGIIAVPVGYIGDDPEEAELFAAISAHGITVTPGTLVVDFKEDASVMYVHCLDVVSGEKELEKGQKYRVTQFRKIVGRPVEVEAGNS